MTKERQGTGFSVLAARWNESLKDFFFSCHDYYYYFICSDVLGRVYT